MIKVKIEDYQSIAEIDLVIQGLTLIVGPSNIGKSSIQRAIYGAMHNDVGDHFVRSGRSTTKVEIDDGDNQIKWIKGAGTNKYIVNGTVFEKVGFDAPPVLREQGYRDLEVEGEVYSAQVADQFDPPFAVSKSGTKLGSLYSALTKTDLLNKASSNCSRDLRAKKQEINLRNKDFKNIEEVVEEQKETPDKIAEIKETLKRFDAIKEKSDRLTFLTELQQKLDHEQSKLEVLAPVSTVKVPKIDLEEKIQRLSLLEEKNVSLALLEGEINVLSGVSQVPLPEIDLTERFSKVESLKEKLEGWDFIESEIQDINNEIEATEDSIAKNKVKLEKFENCPLCGSSLGAEDHVPHSEPEFDDLLSGL